MRWFWIDRFLTFEPGRRATAIKNIALGEEHVRHYLPGFPYMPHSLIIEGLAQTGGLLVSQTKDFRARVVLAKVRSAKFHFLSRPGESLVYAADIETLQDQGSIVKGHCHVGDRLQAEVDLVFANLDDRFRGVELFHTADLLRMLRVLGLFDVARAPDGRPVPPPAYMLDAERAEEAEYSQPRNPPRPRDPLPASG